MVKGELLGDNQNSCFISYLGPAVVDQLLKELKQKVEALENKYKAKLQEAKVS